MREKTTYSEHTPCMQMGTCRTLLQNDGKMVVDFPILQVASHEVSGLVDLSKKSERIYIWYIASPECIWLALIIGVESYYTCS